MEPVTGALIIAALLGGVAAFLEIRRTLKPSSSTPATTQQPDYNAALHNIVTPPTPVAPPAPGFDVTKAAVGGAAPVVGLGMSPGATSAAVTGAAYAGIGAAVIGFASAAVQHHQSAVLNEARDLNTAVPTFFQNVDVVLKATIVKELDAPTAKALIDKSMQNYLLTVTSPGPQSGSSDQFAGQIQMGLGTEKVPFAFLFDSAARRAYFDARIVKWMATPMKLGAGRGKPTDSVPSYIPADPTPTPCNGPCVVFRNNILPTAYRAKLAIDQITSGKHGTLTALQTIGNQYGFQGFPEVSWTW